MRSFSDLVSLGGYGFYVWGSYFFALLAIGGEVVSLSRRKRNLNRENNSVDIFKGSTRDEKAS